MASRSTVKSRNDAMRAAFLQALEEIPGPYNLFGRGHERRETLSPSLAAILRGMDLPRVHISGYGANYYYPSRLVERAMEIFDETLRDRASGLGSSEEGTNG